MSAVGSAASADPASMLQGNRVRLGLLASSPVHYQAPLYRRLEADPRLDFTAMFASTAGARPGEFGYGRPVQFEVDILEGYGSAFLRGARSDRNLDSSLALRNPDVVRRLLAGRFDVLWLHGYNHLVHMLAWGTHRALRRPILIREVQTTIHPRGLLRTLAKEPLLRLLLRNCQALFVGTESRRWFEHYGVPDARLHAVPYAVDNDRLRSTSAELSRDREAIRRSLGLPAGKPVVLTVSRLIPRKQPLQVLEAYRRLRERTDCALLMVGEGSLMRQLRAEVEARRIPDVAMPGFMDQGELVRAYACADIFTLFSSRDETWGAVVNEAMNFGLPIVVSDKVGSARDLVSPGLNGTVVHSGDVEALCEALQRLVDDPELRSSYGQASRVKVVPWNYDAAAAGVVKAVKAAVGEERWARADQARSR